jgi:ABC-type antimicrobial peptide transport system permease subunit
MATMLVAGIALLLAVAGTFGTAAQAIARRTPEIGIRMALGGSHARLRGMLLRENVAPAVAGTVAGILMGSAANQYIGQLIEYGIGVGAGTFVAAAVVVVSTAVVAVWRASAAVLRIQPAEAIRV